MRRNSVLLEMLLAVLFFSLIAAVFVRLLSEAYVQSRDSSRLSAASVALQDVLERGKAAPEAGGRDIYYDADFSRETAEGSSYRIRLDTEAAATPAGTLYTLRATAYAAEDELAALTAAVYAGGAP